MYSALLDWVIENYRLLSGIFTFAIFCSFLYYGYKKKGLNFSTNKWDLVDLILMLTSAYSMFTGFVIVLCCGHIEKLKSRQELYLYLIISGGALIYTCFYGTRKNIDSK